MELKFEYYDVITGSKSNSINIEENDILTFSENRFIKNCLIGVRGEFIKKHVDDAKNRFNEKFPNGIKVDENFWNDKQLISTAKKCLEVLY